MRVRRIVTTAGLAFGLCLAGPVAWADEPAPDPAPTPYCYPVTDGGTSTDGGTGTGADGEVTAEPVPSSEEPAPGEEPTGEPVPDPTGEPVPDPTDEPGEGTLIYCVVASAAEGAPEAAPEAMADDVVTDVTRGSGSVAQLPSTGTPASGLLALGLGLVLAGSVTVVAGTRRPG